MILRFAHITLLAVVATMLAACAGREVPEDEYRLRDWVGESERALVLKWGAPDSVYELQNGNRVLTWRHSRAEELGGQVYTVTETRTVDGKTVQVPVTRQAPVVTRRLECMTNFEVDRSGYVVGYTSEGNDCTVPLPD